MPTIELPRRLFKIAALTAIESFPENETDHPGLSIMPECEWTMLRRELEGALLRTAAAVVVCELSDLHRDAWEAAFMVSADDEDSGVTDEDYQAIVAVIAKPTPGLRAFLETRFP